MQLLTIGLGNMGQALLLGMLAKKETGSAEIQPELYYQDPSEHAAVFAQAHGIKPHQAGQTYDMVLLAVKPQLLEMIAPQLKTLLKPEGLLLSILAGVGTNRLAPLVAPTNALVRVMPNTPAAIGKGVSVCYTAQELPQKHQHQVEALLLGVGMVAWVKEEHEMHAVTALSGSGPAYVFLLIEAMAAAGQTLGLEPELSQKLALHTVSGAAALAESKACGQSAVNPQQLREAVTSPNGTTEAALKQFEKTGFYGIVENAMRAAWEKSQELAQNA